MAEAYPLARSPRAEWASSAPFVSSSLARPVRVSVPSAPTSIVARTESPTSRLPGVDLRRERQEQVGVSVAGVVGGEQHCGAVGAEPGDDAGEFEIGRRLDVLDFQLAAARGRRPARAGVSRRGRARASQGGGSATGGGSGAAGGLPIVAVDGREGAERRQLGGGAGGIGRDADEDRGAAPGDRVGGRRGVGVGEGDGPGEARLRRLAFLASGFSSSAKVPLASWRTGRVSFVPGRRQLRGVHGDQFAALDRQRVAAGGRVGVDDGALEGLAFGFRFFFLGRRRFGRRLGRLRGGAASTGAGSTRFATNGTLEGKRFSGGASVAAPPPEGARERGRSHFGAAPALVVRTPAGSSGFRRSAGAAVARLPPRRGRSRRR